MKKIARLLGIYLAVGVCYIIMMIMQPFTNEVIVTANATVNATNYPETTAFITGWPFWAYMVPATIALVATVITLRSNE